ncbi:MULTISPECIES: PP2C family serine/threonine-protein phosphatase [unclassified Janthinobacterium]|uniref:PP2C family protein-serine/threonine phosphatase n=1 Tax=unclassified Janthinobacterium TaxID=2610881 RepID=UPI00160B9D1D|nr:MULTISPECIES: protein phosphatase 2C domain-containing protein [unclassified Janthinobacterium]MBB5368746.1 serine/threonine protein phosphatase PrpC [Janthinobacterium sp. K2C7]MBB5381718.1 serine/threonine protein phosphatase PrpC [Janthinobacterium sp. K2Li3]MBB5387128.1 serine/threonine protein phosphatase PrpC [Janthinobacterium sp. K2E3]
MYLIKDGLDFGAWLDAAAGSCIGAGPAPRRENQDNFLLIDGSGNAVYLSQQEPLRCRVANWPAGHVRAAVLDGMGGHGHGREAAEAAVQGLLQLPACSDVATLAAGLDALHTRLQTSFEKPPQAAARPPGTTLTLLEIAPGQAPLLYHVGDSRLYEITDDTVDTLTVDHVPATVYAMHGLLNEAQWRLRVHGEHHPQISQAFVLGNAIGDTQELEKPLQALDAGNLPPFLAHLADRRVLQVRDDAVYLLASDGFWACADPLAVVARWPALCAGKTATQALASIFDDFLAQPPYGLHSDNLTMLALRFTPQCSTV